MIKELIKIYEYNNSAYELTLERNLHQIPLFLKMVFNITISYFEICQVKSKYSEKLGDATDVEYLLWDNALCSFLFVILHCLTAFQAD